MSRRTLGLILFGCTIVLIPWTAYLEVTLPAIVSGHHVRDFWVTFDILLAIALGGTALLTLRGRRLAGLTAAATAVLLVADACIDMVWSGPGWNLGMAIVRAVFVELPTAALLLYTARLVLATAPFHTGKRRKGRTAVPWLGQMLVRRQSVARSVHHS